MSGTGSPEPAGTLSGRCMCGAVAFEAEVETRESHACHCSMCRRWTGSAMLAVTVPDGKVTFTGAEHIRTIRSSDWAERAWCDLCGSGLYYRITMEGPMKGTYEFCMGLFDAASELPLAGEIYIDRKPSSFAYAGDHATMTEAEVEAMYGLPASEGDAP